jgi:hypothetical protein
VCKNESLLVYFSIKNKFYNNKKLKKQKWYFILIY